MKWSELETISNEERQETLRSICAINVKKSPGIYIADNAELERVTWEDKKYLNKQFSLYNPDLVICCGSITSNLYHSYVLNQQPVWQLTMRGIWFHEYKPSKYLIQYVHPEARVHPCLLYYGIVDAVKEILKPN